MKIHQLLNEAIEAKNVERARAVVLSLLNKERKLQNPMLQSNANEAQQKFAEQKIEFFHPDDGKTIYHDNQEEWNHQFWEDLNIELEYNFSKQKLDRVFKVMRRLREMNDSDFQPKEEKPQVSSQSNQNPSRQAEPTFFERWKQFFRDYLSVSTQKDRNGD